LLADGRLIEMAAVNVRRTVRAMDMAAHAS